MTQNESKPNYSSSSDEEEEQASGSEDKQASGSGTDESSDSDSGKKPKPEPQKTVTAPPQSGNKPEPPDVSSSGSEDSGSDSDVPPKKSAVVNSTAKPISSKPMEREVGPKVDSKSVKTDREVGPKVDSKSVKTDGSKTKSTSTSSPAKNKRPAPAADPSAVEKEAKKAKPNTANGETKKAVVSSSQPSKSANKKVLSESEDFTDTDSDAPPKKSVVANVKPISSKPMESKLAKKIGSKPVATSSPAKSKPPAPATGVRKKGLEPLFYSKSANKLDLDDISTSSEDSGSDSESDSDSRLKKSVVVPNVKPISSKPATKNGSKTVAASSQAKSKTPATVLATPAKKGKDSVTEDDTKKQLFQRLWSEDDEIAVLEGMIAYKNERKSDPIADVVAFHDFIKKSLHVEVSRGQLADKIRRLKKKFVNNAMKEKDGKDRSFSKSHERKGYELSKLIWGSNSETETKDQNQSNKNGKLKIKINGPSTSTGKAGVNLVKPNGLDEKDRVMMEVDKKFDVSRFVSYGGMSDSLVMTEEIVKAGMEMVDGSKRVELEAKWRKLKEQELELYLKRMELLKEQALVVLEAVRSSGN